MRCGLAFHPLCLPIHLLAGLFVAGIAPEIRAQRGGFDGDFREAAKYGWLSSYQEGLNQAARLRKPMMLVFRCVP